MSETELFFRLSEDKLRGRALWAGGALMLSLVMPYEIWDEQPHFLWQLFGELPAAGIVAAVSGAVAGLAVIVMRRFVKGGAELAMAVLAALFGWFIAARFGARASSWGVLPLPQSMTAFKTVIVDDRVQERESDRPMLPYEQITGDLTELVSGQVAIQSGDGPAAFAFRGISLGDYAAAVLAVQRAGNLGD